MGQFKEFKIVLREVQEFISTTYEALFISKEEEKKNKEKIKIYIKKFVEDKNIKIEGHTKEELIDKLYTEMIEYSFLTKYLKRRDIEEININSWDDVKITYSDGRIERNESFENKKHAIDIVRRLLRSSNMVIDNSKPIVVGHLNEKIRITALGNGIIDKNVGIVCSIRIVNPKELKKEDFVKNGTLTEEMIDFLELSQKYGSSTCFAGATSSGKTTLMSYILGQIPYSKRLFTIENGTREFNLVKRNEKGEILNNVIHTVTKDSDDKKQKIDMAKLLETALTVNPDFICVAEMKSEEAFFAQEASRSGHTVTTTIHSGSCRESYFRMVTLCKQKFNMEDKTLYNLVTEAFPIVVYCKKLEDNSRKVTEIIECNIKEDGTREIKTLYRYVVTKNNPLKIEGHYEKVNEISENLIKKLRDNGISEEDLKKIK